MTSFADQPPLEGFALMESIKFGNAYCRINLATSKRPTFNAALRHMMAMSSHTDAIRLAQRICGMTEDEATLHIRTLARTKPNDIVSPHLSGR